MSCINCTHTMMLFCPYYSAQNNSWSLANFPAKCPNDLAKQLTVCQSIQWWPVKIAVGLAQCLSILFLVILSSVLGHFFVKIMTSIVGIPWLLVLHPGSEVVIILQSFIEKISDPIFCYISVIQFSEFYTCQEHIYSYLFLNSCGNSSSEKELALTVFLF